MFKMYINKGIYSLKFDKLYQKLYIWDIILIGAGEGTRTLTLFKAIAPQTIVSTNSTTPARPN